MQNIKFIILLLFIASSLSSCIKDNEDSQPKFRTLRLNLNNIQVKASEDRGKDLYAVQMVEHGGIPIIFWVGIFDGNNVSDIEVPYINTSQEYSIECVCIKDAVDFVLKVDDEYTGVPFKRAGRHDYEVIKVGDNLNTMVYSPGGMTAFSDLQTEGIAIENGTIHFDTDHYRYYGNKVKLSFDGSPVEKFSGDSRFVLMEMEKQFFRVYLTGEGKLADEITLKIEDPESGFESVEKTFTKEELLKDFPETVGTDFHKSPTCPYVDFNMVADKNMRLIFSSTDKSDSCELTVTRGKWYHLNLDGGEFKGTNIKLEDDDDLLPSTNSSITITLEDQD